jgi:polyisoprenoid-binding protein YceI
MFRSHRSSRKPTIAVAAVLTALLIPCADAPAARAADTYTIDVSHSNVSFSIRHFFSKVPGRFGKYEGTIVYDPEDLGKSSVNVTIDAASIDTDLADRDKHLKSPDFFDVEKFPKITFASAKVKPVGKNKAQVEGTLTIKGVSKPVTLDIEVLGTGPDAWGNTRGGFEGRTRVNRQDFGVSWNKVVEGGGTILGDEVEIILNVEAVRQAPKPPEPAAKK